MADYGMYDGMEKVYNTTCAKVVVDSTFNIGKKDYLIELTQKYQLEAEALLLNRAATSISQLSDWVMCMIEGSFLRLRGPLKYEEHGDMMVILRLAVHLYNFYCFHVGIDQIQHLCTNKTIFSFMITSLLMQMKWSSCNNIN